MNEWMDDNMKEYTEIKKSRYEWSNGKMNK